MRRCLSWPRQPLPEGHGEVWRADLVALAELSRARARLRSRLAGAGSGAGEDDELTDHVVLAFDELASNALRHGGSPVVATVTAGPGGWLLDVSDRAPDVMPAPTVDRDPVHGGMGLQLVARLSAAHGWYVDDGSKHVWACVPSGAATQEPVPA